MAASSSRSAPSRYIKSRSPLRIPLFPLLLISLVRRPTEARVRAFSSEEQLPSRRKRRASSRTVYNIWERKEKKMEVVAFKKNALTKKR